MDQQPDLEQHSANGSVEGPTDQDPESGGAVERPAELLRLAHMVQATLNEARAVDVDQEGRERLSDIYNRAVTEIREILSDDLQDELDDVAVVPFDDVPSSGELRIAQAQLVGWLQGLFQGIQASMATQAMSARQQQGGQPQVPGGGQYL